MTLYQKRNFQPSSYTLLLVNLTADNIIDHFKFIYLSKVTQKFLIQIFNRFKQIMKWRNIHIQTPFPPRLPTQEHGHKKYTPTRSEKSQNISQDNKKNSSQDKFESSFQSYNNSSRVSKNSNNSQQKNQRKSLELIKNKNSVNKLQLKTHKIQRKNNKLNNKYFDKKYYVTQDWVIRLKIQINKLLKCSQNLSGMIKNYVSSLSKQLKKSHQKLKQEMTRQMVEITYQIAMMNIPTFSQQNINMLTNQKNIKDRNGNTDKKSRSGNGQTSKINIEIDDDMFSPVHNFSYKKFSTGTKEKTNSNKRNLDRAQSKKNDIVHQSNVSIAVPGTQTTLKQLLKPFVTSNSQLHDDYGNSSMNIKQSNQPEQITKTPTKPKNELHTKPPQLSPILFSHKSSQFVSDLQLHLQSNQKLKESNTEYGGKDLVLQYSKIDNSDKKHHTSRQKMKQKNINHEKTVKPHQANKDMQSTLTNLNNCINNMKKLLSNPK